MCSYKRTEDYRQQLLFPSCLAFLGGGEGFAVLLQPHVYEGSKVPFLVPNKNSSRFVLCRPSKYVRAINPCQSFSHVFLPCLQALLESECSSSSGWCVVREFVINQSTYQWLRLYPRQVLPELSRLLTALSLLQDVNKYEVLLTLICSFNAVW